MLLSLDVPGQKFSATPSASVWRRQCSILSSLQKLSAPQIQGMLSPVHIWGHPCCWEHVPCVCVGVTPEFLLIPQSSPPRYEPSVTVAFSCSLGCSLWFLLLFCAVTSVTWRTHAHTLIDIYADRTKCIFKITAPGRGTWISVRSSSA